MNDANPRQQIVDSIKNNSNILVTVSTSPSVDELSAALALTILLNNLNKRATAVVSGAIPPAITFLDPDKTFEDTVNSLRDFIIALDKEKADHLRYKVDGDVVKIFITPYRTTLTEKDLDFSQGDYNVEFVIALGVKDKDHLDKALDAHGRILHDATVATIMAGDETSNLGSIMWQDASASCLSEMLVSLTEALKDDKPVLDEQIATALLTGIVSATDRFSNNRTSSRIMTMAAQLMAAGANQQLIAAKLEEAHDIGPSAPVTTAKGDQTHADGTTSLSEGEGTKLGGSRKKSKKEKTPTDGLEIAHDEKKPKPKDDKPTEDKNQESSVEEGSPTKEETITAPSEPIPEPVTDQPVVEDAEQKLAAELGQLTPPETPAPDLSKELEEAKQEEASPLAAEMPPLPPVPPMEEVNQPEQTPQPPVFDFEALLPKSNPTLPPASNDNQPPLPPVPPAEPVLAPTAEISSTHNDNNYVSGETSPNSPLNGIQSDTEPVSVDPFAKPLISPSLPPLQPDPLFDTQHADSVPATAATIQPPTDTSGMPPFEETPIPNDPAAVAAVPDFAAMNPTGLAESTAPPLPSLDSVPPPPPLPDFSSLPPLPPVPNLDPVAPATAPQNLEDMFPAGQSIPAPEAPPAAPATPPPPGQFRIPGQ